MRHTEHTHEEHESKSTLAYTVLKCAAHSAGSDLLENTFAGNPRRTRNARLCEAARGCSLSRHELVAVAQTACAIIQFSMYSNLHTSPEEQRQHKDRNAAKVKSRT